MTNPLWTGARRHSGFSASLAFPAASACLLSVLLLGGCKPALTPAELECVAAVGIVEVVAAKRQGCFKHPPNSPERVACIDDVSARFEPLAEACADEGGDK